MAGFNPGDILKGGGAILVVLLVGMMLLSPFLASAGVKFDTPTALIITFIGFALIMGLALNVYDLATSGAGFTFGKFIPLIILGVALFLTLKYGMPLIAKLSPSAASVFPIP